MEERNTFVSLIDDYSRKKRTYLLKHKSEKCEKFKVWKLLVENQTDKNFKTLRTNNGLEFCSEEFNRFCEQNGIKRHMIQDTRGSMVRKTTKSKQLKDFWMCSLCTYRDGKLDSSSIKCVFLGYRDGVKGYRLVS